MSIQPLRDLAVSVNLLVHGVPATVTIPGGAPVVTRLIWQRHTVTVPSNGEAQLADARRVAALPKSALSSLPRNTLVMAPEKVGGAQQTWRVDGFEQTHEPELYRVVLVPV